MVPDLDIVMDGRRIGSLDGRDPSNPRIVYEASWRDDPGATPLSVSMPLSSTIHPPRVVLPYLWGLLPDNERVLARWGTEYQCSPRNVVALLGYVGADVAGAAEYLAPGQAPDADPGSVEPLTTSDVAGMLREVRQDATAWHPRSHPGQWSLGGAQGKLALARDEATGTWGVPSGSQPTTHVLKPALAGMEHHDVNEHLCLTAAGLLGLPVSATRIGRFGDERALVVTRYDRITGGAGGIQRIHQEDFCQALSIHPAMKYENEGGPGIEDMARLLRTVIVDQPTRQVKALCRAVAYNWLVLGTDAHAKNYSLLLSGGQVRVAPLYDIASSVLYQHPRRLKLAQRIGGEYRVVTIARRHWERLARSTRLDPGELLSDIETMIDRLPDALVDAASTSDLTPDERSYATALRAAITEWLDHCRRAMRS